MVEKRKEEQVPFIPLSRDKFDALGMILSDPMGSYTGVPADRLEKPVQDADDL